MTLCLFVLPPCADLRLVRQRVERRCNHRSTHHITKLTLLPPVKSVHQGNVTIFIGNGLVSLVTSREVSRGC